ncbi:M81 family metallopeptidase [Phytoactinopolyspora limicola]|uniref:M81 family metallopeptidase n=1 Tax=Phytoactinopolyspora limicola TaxID=2715536 RepID=UPI00140B72DA|nr:M81 family metallopeptidase [Phytoactinopolyspora limicola]
MPRIAVLGLSHEANTFSSRLVDNAVFEAEGVLRGPEIPARHAGGTSTVSGFLAAGERLGIELVPLVMSTMVPSGVITADALKTRADELVDALSTHGPFDAVLASLHGAAVSEEILDVDGYLLGRFRDVVGPAVPIGVSLDLHANISAAMCQYSDVLNTYRTNPHVDAHDVAEEVAEIIVRTVRGEVRPTQAHVPIPAAINILCQNTDESPMRDLLADARALMATPGVLSATVAEGYPYADVPEMGMSVVVVTNNDPAAAQQHARHLANRVWSHRARFDVAAPSPDAAIAEAQAAAHTPTLLLDVGDNIGGGSPGDSVVLLNAARATGYPELLTIVADAAAASACHTAGRGATIELSIGGKTDPRTGPPARAHGEVLALHHGTFQVHGPVHAGMSHVRAGPSAAVRLDSGQTVIVTTEAVMPLGIDQLTTLGLAPEQFGAIVAKGVHSPLAGYGPYVAGIVRVDTPGITAASLDGFTYHHRPRPMFPFEPETTYSP